MIEEIETPVLKSSEYIEWLMIMQSEDDMDEIEYYERKSGLTQEQLLDLDMSEFNSLINRMLGTSGSIKPDKQGGWNVKLDDGRTFHMRKPLVKDLKRIKGKDQYYRLKIVLMRLSDNQLTEADIENMRLGDFLNILRVQGLTGSV